MIFIARLRSIPASCLASPHSNISISFANGRAKSVEADRKLLRDFLKQEPALSAVETRWGTTLFPRLVNGNTDAFLERLRFEFDTSAVPGRFFEMPDHFRIGMGVNTKMFAEGLNRIGLQGRGD